MKLHIWNAHSAGEIKFKVLSFLQWNQQQLKHIE